MEPIKFNYPPDVAVKYIENIVEKAKTDPQISDQQRAVFEDIQTLVHLAQTILMPVQAPAPGGTGKNIKS